MGRQIVLMTVLLASLCGRAVAAPAVVNAAPRRDWQIYGVLGLGTPVGGFGLEGARRFGEQLELAIGVGDGLSASSAQPNGSFGHAVQWSVMPRLRLGDDSDAFTFGIGLSGGEYADGKGSCLSCLSDDSSSSDSPTQYTLWTNFEIGAEHLSRSGFAIRYFLGIGGGYLGSDRRWLSYPVPYTGVGLGYAF